MDESHFKGLIEIINDIAANHPRAVDKDTDIDRELDCFPGYIYEYASLRLGVVFPDSYGSYCLVDVVYNNHRVFRAGFLHEINEDLEPGEEEEELQRLDLEYYHPGEWENKLKGILEETYRFISTPKGEGFQLSLF